MIVPARSSIVALLMENKSKRMATAVHLVVCGRTVMVVV